MATLYVSAISSTQVMWSVGSLQNPWNTNQYKQIVLSSDRRGTSEEGTIYEPSSIIQRMYPPNSTNTSKDTQSEVAGSGFSAGNQYHLYAYAKIFNDTWWYVDDISIIMPYPVPAHPSVSWTAIDATTIQLSWNYVANATEYEVSFQGQYYRTTGNSYVFYNLQPNTSYTMGVNAYGQGGWSGITWVYPKTPAVTLTKWKWTVNADANGDKVPGVYQYIITAKEWNDFDARINAYREAKGLGPYGIADAIQYGIFRDYQFNQAVDAINAMNPPIPPPAKVTKDVGVSNIIGMLNGLKNSLNSIT
jgi:hypothetical protein